ncbi:hypothetical protein, partial [Escherichia coli]|uniref:hypothetical protein n=1 Tax=Escherichia coli TaxID=562 RepID=UPI00384E5E45
YGASGRHVCYAALRCCVSTVYVFFLDTATSANYPEGFVGSVRWVYKQAPAPLAAGNLASDTNKELLNTPEALPV